MLGDSQVEEFQLEKNARRDKDWNVTHIHTCSILVPCSTHHMYVHVPCKFHVVNAMCTCRFHV